MGERQQKIPTDEEAEQELQDAEEAFGRQATEEKANERNAVPGSSDPRAEEAAKEFIKQLENVGTAQAEAPEKTPSPKKEETAKENQQILAALGFKKYEDAGAIKYNIRVMDIKIGVTFNETNPLGKIWAYKIPEGNEEKEFLKNGDLKQHPLILKYRAIQEGKESLPEASIAGKILEKRGKAIKVEITENGEKLEIFFGQGAVKKDSDGYFVPAGFSKATKDHEAKMTLSRDIRLPDYLTEMKQAPVADVTKEKDVPKEKGEPQSTEKTTMDKVIKREPTEYTEAIAKYTGILAEVTEAISTEDRIPSREKGYGVKFVYHSVISETKKMELSESTIMAIAKAMADVLVSLSEKEDNHEEQA